MNMKKFKFKMPRLNLIIGKKQIIIVGLTLVLGIAIYANYLLGTSGNIVDSLEAEKGKSNYGDTTFVSKTNDTERKDVELSTNGSDAEAYFAQARLDKQESRDEAKEFLSAMYNGGDTLGEEMQVIAQDAAKMSNYIESESKIESLLKAQGFDEALCYLSDNSANIIVKTAGLATEDAAKIKTTLLSEISVPAENITILEIN